MLTMSTKAFVGGLIWGFPLRSSRAGATSRTTSQPWRLRRKFQRTFLAVCEARSHTLCFPSRPSPFIRTSLLSSHHGASSLWVPFQSLPSLGRFARSAIILAQVSMMLLRMNICATLCAALPRLRSVWGPPFIWRSMTLMLPFLCCLWVRSCGRFFSLFGLAHWLLPRYHPVSG